MMTEPWDTWDAAWNNCMLRFFEHLESLSGSAHTVRNYRGQLAHFFADMRHPEQYTQADVAFFIASPCIGLYHHGQAPKSETRNARLTAISSFYRFAAGFTIAGEHGHPVALYQHPSPTTGMRHGAKPMAFKAFDEPSLKAFFKAINDYATNPDDPYAEIRSARDKSLFLFLYYSARRVSEALSLTWSSITQTTFSGRAAYQYAFRGKGRSRIEDKAEIPGFVVEAIHTYLAKSGRLSTIKADDPLWVSVPPPHGGGMLTEGPLSGEAVNKRIRLYCGLAGLAGHFSAHSFRHSSALHRVHAGEDVTAISRLLRHANLAVTSNYLTGLLATEDKGAARLAAWMGEL